MKRNGAEEAGTVTHKKLETCRDVLDCGEALCRAVRELASARARIGELEATGHDDGPVIERELERVGGRTSAYCDAVRAFDAAIDRIRKA